MWERRCFFGDWVVLSASCLPDWGLISDGQGLCVVYSHVISENPEEIRRSFYYPLISLPTCPAGFFLAGQKAGLVEGFIPVHQMASPFSPLPVVSTCPRLPRTA